MEPKHNDWKVLQLFTLAVIATIPDSALLNIASLQAATISKPTIEERLATVREYLKQRGEILTDPSNSLSLPQENPQTENSNAVLGQWNDWNDWSKWSKWSDWPNY